ncbi:PLP-dependent transferase [Geofilum rubicundum]|uniref:O-acetylhomoserine sulfhydrylase n=1 Tax=Geofilum rubicundum JCM 15548 TaxID=1236989 RepID=A0A0E9LZH0_9BACT|nr:PLP-dependent transferase [Geofilum rubicundum]GAO30270.1 O-acetylhomoserine sulfhydrylase [Geofilum rubicundum JCM 15548]
MQHISSRLIHGQTPQKDATFNRSLKTPIFESASFDFATAEEAENAFTGASEAFAYSRISNPTVTELQNRLKVFSNAEHCLCVASGMAAISNVFLTLCSSGDNIITSQYLFGNTLSFFSKTLRSFGIEARFSNLEQPSSIIENIDDNTRAIFLELPTNPQLIVFDVPAISQIAREKNIPLIVDNTVLTPYLFPCDQHNVDIEIFSNTKFVSGGATSIGGTILVYPSDKWANNPKLEADCQKFGRDAFYKRLFKEIYRNIGACLSPNNAYLQLLGLETLTLRIDRIMDNTLEIARFLQDQPKVETVRYGALENDPGYNLTKQLSQGKAGCLINMALKDKTACFQFMNALEMIRRGTNFCDNKSMIIHPASTIYWDFSREDKQKMCISEGMLRLSVGLEDLSDIKADIEQALSTI